MILPCSNADTACARAEQIRLSIQNMRFSNGDKAINVTASFGVTSGMPSDYEQMIGTAFTALYRAKEQGRNCVALLKLDHQEKMNQP
jgi:diguanylate cyclase (GGDEF)-like protein